MATSRADRSTKRARTPDDSTLELEGARQHNLHKASDAFPRRNVVGCLYRADVEAYVSACRAPVLETCAAFRSACEVQLGRLRDVCGLDV